MTTSKNRTRIWPQLLVLAVASFCVATGIRTSLEPFEQATLRSIAGGLVEIDHFDLAGGHVTAYPNTKTAGTFRDCVVHGVVLDAAATPAARFNTLACPGLADTPIEATAVDSDATNRLPPDNGRGYVLLLSNISIPPATAALRP